MRFDLSCRGKLMILFDVFKKQKLNVDKYFFSLIYNRLAVGLIWFFSVVADTAGLNGNLELLWELLEVSQTARNEIGV